KVLLTWPDQLPASIGGYPISINIVSLLPVYPKIPRSGVLRFGVSLIMLFKASRALPLFSVSRLQHPALWVISQPSCRGKERHSAGLSYAQQSYMGACAFLIVQTPAPSSLGHKPTQLPWQRTPLCWSVLCPAELHGRLRFSYCPDSSTQLFGS